MCDEQVIKEKYGKDYTYEKWYSTEIDLEHLPKNKAVVFGDGETYCWMLTKIDKESVPAETLVMPKFTYIKTPLNKYTFSMPKIKQWVETVAKGLTLNLFAGKTKLNLKEVRNDIRENMLADYHLDALEFCCTYNGELFDTVILDPPYSLRKSMEMYEGKITSPFNAIKDELLRITNENCRVITFGYHSVVMGKKRGFEIEEILLMSHGGAIHDTLATVERKLSA